MSSRRQFLAGLAIGVSSMNATITEAAPKSRRIVLVHGAFAGSSSWSEVIALLQARGFEVEAVPLPLSGLADDVAATREVLARQAGPGPCPCRRAIWG
jgi:alpha-beta hydrolase superfamily lysophospholipase